MDLHISVIADFKQQFPEFDITDWCLSGHSWVMNKQRVVPKHINQKNWIQINEEMIRLFQAEYDEFLKQFDGFICGHPNGFVPIFEKYGKPIILINSCRYDLPFCWSKNYDMLQKYKDCLVRLNNKRLLISVSNNKADQYYTKLGCGIMTTHIPSLCAYTGMKYNPIRSTFLVYHGNFPRHPLLTDKAEIGTRFSWSQLTEFKGIVHIPYEVSAMSMFEQFTAGIPLFFPSKVFMREKADIQSVSAYWKADLPVNISALSKKDAWLDLADFYEVFKSPNVYLYDSFEHLIHLLENFKWQDDTEILAAYRKKIREEWVTLLSTHYIMGRS
jgi:hypothetical protein